jgi:hypothetical protein
MPRSTSKNIRFTDKQIEIMDIIMKTADEGYFIAGQDLWKALSYRCAYQSLLCSVYYLENYGCLRRVYTKSYKLECRRGERMFIKPTEMGYSLFRRSPEPS